MKAREKAGRSERARPAPPRGARASTPSDRCGKAIARADGLIDAVARAADEADRGGTDDGTGEPDRVGVQAQGARRRRRRTAGADPAGSPADAAPPIRRRRTSARRAAPRTFTIPRRIVSPPKWRCTPAQAMAQPRSRRPPASLRQESAGQERHRPGLLERRRRNRTGPVRGAGEEEARARPQAAGQGLRGSAQARDGDPDVGVGVRHGLPGVAELRESRDRQGEERRRTSCSRNCAGSRTRTRPQ